MVLIFSEGIKKVQACQVKECKIISEPSLLTGWQASWLAVFPTSFPIFPYPVGHNPGTRLRLLSPQAVQESVYTSRS